MRSRSLVSRLVVLAVALMLPISALAGDEVGKMRGNSSSIEWDLTRGGHDSITLTVQDDQGAVYEKTFRGNAPVSFRTSDLKGCPSGTYTYELRVTPQISGAVKSALAAARAAGDDARIAEIMKANGLTTQVVQSGAFGASNCAFLDPSAVESDANDSNAAGSSLRGSVSSSATRAPGNVSADDQVIPDDLIVQSSICAGFDCVDGESFGFDTIRMKENNTQINFTDTSTSAGYPSNDWTIVANDSASGGANYLAFNDVTAGRKTFLVEAAAPANALYVDSTGNIGISQSAPGLDLHMTTTDTPAIRLEQTSAGGFTAQTWDIGANEANFFVRDLTGGSRLSFRIRPGAPTSSIDISADGDVGMGTASPNANARLDLQDSTQLKARLALTGQEYFAAATSSTDGVGLVLGVNRTGNRQLWIGDTANLTQNSTNSVIRLFPSNTNASDISAVATDGTTAKSLSLNVNGGNVGVGISAPTSKFHVNGGDIRVSGGSFIDDGVTLNVPDYVFEDSYKLMSVDELSTFIKANKHLPNVPSAKDIAAKGINMSKFQMSLLEKVEELTLYTVSQHEQIGSLKAQNEQLMERLAALEAAIGNK